ncbi:hypothetical protein L211DRAFT_843127 [Terfezia boudieri ATCC MYA-4762]|uniref:Uncharacterized protein n=1 Tax=Terfezia boudieri ATCC MYA-4762 TaxID=1051890 RepID=A0A3N4LC12_9PEZI|nr:hypothetical protein L211DRAFT_843127 [Terfezia boudieri ATCC MYA-4762]
MVPHNAARAGSHDFGFLQANLDSIIRSEASYSKECECQNFNKILVQIVERRQVEIRDRLSNILAVRADICIRDDMATLKVRSAQVFVATTYIDVYDFPHVV